VENQSRFLILQALLNAYEIPVEPQDVLERDYGALATVWLRFVGAAVNKEGWYEVWIPSTLVYLLSTGSKSMSVTAEGKAYWEEASLRYLEKYGEEIRKHKAGTSE
jgi:hypothetical protein